MSCSCRSEPDWHFSGGRTQNSFQSAAEDSRSYNACDLKMAFYVNPMSEHKMTLTWKRGDAPFDYQKYPRDHTWKFAGGQEMTASAAPAHLGDPKNVNPEEA